MVQSLCSEPQMLLSLPTASKSSPSLHPFWGELHGLVPGDWWALEQYIQEWREGENGCYSPPLTPNQQSQDGLAALLW